MTLSFKQRHFLLNAESTPKEIAWGHIKKLRELIKKEPLGGRRTELRLNLLRWQDKHKEAIANERGGLKLHLNPFKGYCLSLS